MHAFRARSAGVIFLTIAALGTCVQAEPIPVRHPVGSAHGWVVLKDRDGKVLATGDMTQVPHGSRVSSHLVFHFLDGSVDEESTVFTQEGVFRLVSDRHIQRGPSFPKPIDVRVDVATGEVTSLSKDGTFRHDHMDLPPDLANGLPPNLLMNLNPKDPETKISFVAPTDKPRLIHLSMRPGGEVPYKIGGSARKATDFIVHVELGGLAGAIAPLVGKQPSDFHIWILTGEYPAFIREEGAFFEGGPIWRVEQTSPTFSE